MMASATPLVGGIIEELEREDNERGPEPDEGEGLLLRVLVPPNPRAAGTDPSCLAPYGNGGVQCDHCGGWFGVTFWTCPACQSIALWERQVLMEDRPQLPLRPTPHERDGRDQAPAPARPHPRTARARLGSTR
ncbi:hypothetical protein ACFQ93_40515 [Streptomyces sp. NPDC056601]|uniref:hypothetical protein n=1 Tax=Streptomyces sp. NPDC056601 TaxID=3345875 RepID=UPI0036ABE8CE